MRMMNFVGGLRAPIVCEQVWYITNYDIKWSFLNRTANYLRKLVVYCKKLRKMETLLYVLVVLRHFNKFLLGFIMKNVI